MKNSEYWSKRLEELEKAQALNETRYIETLKEEYEKALSKITKETNGWLVRFAINNQISLKDSKKWLNTNELKELKWDVDEYIKFGQENGIDLIWKKELENASSKIHISRLEALQMRIRQEIEKLSYEEQHSTEDFIINTYKDTYYKLAYELQKGHNVAFQVSALDTETIKKVISKPWTIDNQTFSDRIWKNKRSLINILQTELTQSIIRGKAPDEVIEKIAKQFRVSKNKAGTLVMTESAFFASSARKKCFNDLDVEKYEVVATLDSHTSNICKNLDRKVFDMKDYKEGVTAPPFHVRCRSTTAPYFDDEFEFGERAARNANGKTYYVSNTIKYNEWYEKYIDNSEKSDIILINSQQQAINQYISSESYKINEKLRNNIKLNVDDINFRNNLDLALTKCDNYEGNIVRVLDIQDKDLLDEFLDRIEEEKLSTWNEYLSFSNKENYNENANIKIYVNSHKAKDLRKYNFEESEIIYPRNSKFITKRIKKENDKYYILLEEIDE